jgi:hypothetical protein
MPAAAPSPNFTLPARRLAGPRAGFILLLGLLALVPAAKAILYDTLDPDSFIHLLAADQMTREGVGPIVDRQSYMSLPEPWTPYSWLAELGMKLVWDRAGYQGGILTHALMAAGIIGLYAVACVARLGPQSRGGANVYVRAAVATAFASVLTIPYLSFRPATAALLIMAAIAWVLVRDRARGERTRAAWLVVPLTALLVNVHLYAVVVPAWLAALWAGAAWELWRMRHDPADMRREARRRLLRYTVLGAGAALGCLATPMLPGMVRAMAFYQSADPMVAGSVVKEYLPFHAGPTGKVSLVLVLVMLGVTLVRRRALRAGEVLWLLGGVILLLRMGRFSPIFAMAAAPVFAAALPALSDRVLTRPVLRVGLVTLLLLGVVRSVREFPRATMQADDWLQRPDAESDLPGYPAHAAAFVERHVTPRTGRLINEYTWGGYLSWRLTPRFQVLLDGRTHVYPPAFWRAVYMSGPEELSAMLRGTNADAAVLPVRGSRFEPVLTAQGWRVAHADARAVVLVPPG